MAKNRKADALPLKGQELLDSVSQDGMKKSIPQFNIGDTLDVSVRIREGGRERTQVFQGICIGRKGRGIHETITVRRMVQSEGVERVFPLHSPNVLGVKVVRRGKARRAKLHYLRGRTGKASKVTEIFGKNDSEQE